MDTRVFEYESILFFESSCSSLCFEVELFFVDRVRCWNGVDTILKINPVSCLLRTHTPTLSYCLVSVVQDTCRVWEHHPGRHCLTMAKILRKTLQLPTTTFPMRANAAQREKEYMQRTTTQLYRWMREKRDRDGAEPFELHDGPPYANGNLHTGHLLNKVLKDITNRFQLLQGKHVRFIPGWDCHGLPIELKALEEGKLDRTTADALTIRTCVFFYVKTTETQQQHRCCIVFE